MFPGFFMAHLLRGLVCQSRKALWPYGDIYFRGDMPSMCLNRLEKYT